MSSRRTGRRTVLVGVVLVLAVLGLTGAALARGRGPDPSAGTPITAPSAAPPAASPSAASAPLVVPEESQTSAPTRLRIPRLGVDSALEHLRTDRTGRLRAPEHWQSAGWFSQGTRPGATGPAVLAGHVDSPTGPAVFARLAELHPGDLVDVDQRDGSTVRFRVDRAEVVGKRAFPTDAVYGPTPDAQLRLITCGGAYVADSGGYQDNLVVFATEVSP